LLENTNQLVSESNELLKENKTSIKSTISDTRTMITNADTLLTSLNDLFSEIKKKENNLGKALYDEEMLTNLQSVMMNVKELTKILVDQLKKEGIKVDANLDLF
jgi:ABC-type transporter Mla subunit MlaD